MSGVRIVNSFEFDQKNLKTKAQEILSLYPNYKESDGFIFKVVKV